MSIAATPPKLLDRVRHTIRMRHPTTLRAPEITAFLSWLATSQQVSASTQNQALSALLFLYRHVLHIDLGPIEPAASGAGLRLQESLELRVKDLDFERHEILVRRGKGQKDRRTMLPASLDARLHEHLAGVQRQHERDLAAGYGRVVLPVALARKYPNAETAWGWQFVFPATDLLRAGHDIRTVQELLGHADVATAMVYTHVLNRGPLGVGSLDGRVWNKGERLEDYRSRNRVRRSERLEEPSVRVFGDTAVVTFAGSVEGVRDGREINSRSYFTRVYLRRNGQWQLIHQQGALLERVR